jgi:hypothetical protein
MRNKHANFAVESEKIAVTSDFMGVFMRDLPRRLTTLHDGETARKGMMIGDFFHLPLITVPFPRMD